MSKNLMNQMISCRIYRLSMAIIQNISEMGKYAVTGANVKVEGWSSTPRHQDSVLLPWGLAGNAFLTISQ